MPCDRLAFRRHFVCFLSDERSIYPCGRGDPGWRVVLSFDGRLAPGTQARTQARAGVVIIPGTLAVSRLWKPLVLVSFPARAGGGRVIR